MSSNGDRRERGAGLAGVGELTDNGGSFHGLNGKARKEDASALMAEVSAQAEQLKSLETRLEDVQQRLNNFLMHVPNVPHASVPTGRDAEANVELRRFGEPKPFSFPAKDHVDIGEGLGLLDFETATKIAQARFVVMKGGLSRLHRALAQFMLDVHTQEHGYTEVYAPYLVNADSMRGTGQFPKFEDDQFAIAADGLYLIPTAEVPVTNIVRGEILAGAQLPMKFVCHTPCFRREAGSYGKDTRGMIRQHQFDKVELVQIIHPEQSYAGLEELTGHAEPLLKNLGLPSGCRGRMPTAKFPHAAILKISRRGACRRDTATTKTSPSWCTL